MENLELFKKFKELGWSNDAQSISIFNFLMNAKKTVLPNQIIFDFGAGQCRYKFFFNHCYYISVDFAQGDTRWDYSKLDFFGNICNLNFIKNESVDYCLNTVTLEHINEPSQFFSEVYRILKPSGKLFLYAPFVATVHQIPFDYFRYTYYGLKYLSEKNGLDVISIKSTNDALHTGSRFALEVLERVYGKNILIRAMLKIFKLFFKKIVLPIFDFFEKSSSYNDFPICWTLIAVKKGLQDEKKQNIIKNKLDVINSIICCPYCRSDLLYSANLCVCLKCNKKFVTKNGQIDFLNII